MQQFTDKAKVALQKAAKAAKDLHQSYIGSEHILVGLVKEKTGVAARVLAENGVDEVQLISMIKELIAPEGMLRCSNATDTPQGLHACWRTATGLQRNIRAR